MVYTRTTLQLLFAAALCVSVSAFSMEQVSDHLKIQDTDTINEYDGQEITPDMIEAMAAQQVPQHVKDIIVELNDVNPELLPTLMRFDRVADWSLYANDARQALVQFGTPAMSNNWIWRLTPGLLGRIASQRSRMVNSVHKAGLGYDKINALARGITPNLTPAERAVMVYNNSQQDLATIPVVATYQTVSQYPTWLKCKKANKLMGNSGIEIAETYLVRANSKQGLSDDSHIIVQRAVPTTGAEKYVALSTLLDPLITKLKSNIEPEKTNAEIQALLNKVSDETVLNVLRIIIYAGLWAMDTNILVNNDGTVCLTDFEQPDNSYNFQHQKGAYYRPGLTEVWKYQHNVAAGINGFYNQFKHAPGKKALIQHYIAESALINGFSEDKRKEIRRFVELER